MFLSRFYPGAKTFWVPTPTYGNHNPIIKDSGLDIKQYRYYDNKTGGLDFEGMKEDLQVSEPCGPRAPACYQANPRHPRVPRTRPTERS